MAGVKGRSGGQRPGAGRKSDQTRIEQATFRARFEQCVSLEDWDACILALLRAAREGNIAAFRELAPWVAGAPPRELALTGKEGGEMRFTIAIDRASGRADPEDR